MKSRERVWERKVESLFRVRGNEGVFEKIIW